MSKNDDMKKTRREFMKDVEDKLHAENAQLRKDVDDLKEITMHLCKQLIR